MKQRIILGFFLLFGFAKAFGQQGISLGCKVIDANNHKALPHATVSLSGKRSGNGYFSGLKTGNYQLIVSYTGYKNDTTIIALTKDTLFNISLKQATRELAEVVIRSNVPPVSVRRDTVAFNTSAYPTPPHATVADLLRQLPGVSIDGDGNVSMQGKKVDQLTINGKTFTLGDPRAIMQELPADMVAQVEAYDTQSGTSKNLGRKEITNTKTINLKIKKNRKNSYFGEQYAGAGTSGSYNAGGNLNQFTDDRRFSLNVNANNTGTAGTNFGRAASAVPGITQSAFASLNYGRDFSKKLFIALDANYNQRSSSVDQLSTRNTTLGDSSLLTRQGGSSGNSSHAFNFFGRIEYKTDQHNGLFYNFNFNRARNTQLTGDSLLNQVLLPAGNYTDSRGYTQNSSTNSNTATGQSLNYYHKFLKEGRNLSASLDYTTGNNPVSGSTFTSLYTDSAHNIVDQRYLQPVDNRHFGADLAYDEPMDKQHLVKLHYRAAFDNSRTDKQSLDRDSVSGLYDLPDALNSNTVSSRQVNQLLSAAYSNDINRKLYYQVGTGLQFTKQENSVDAAQAFARNDFDPAPVDLLQYHMADDEMLELRYNGNAQAPNVSQIQPLPDLSNPLLIRLGNLELNAAFIHSLDFNFRRFNAANGQSLEFGMNGNYVERPIGIATTILAGGAQQVQYVNTAPSGSASVNGSFGFPLIDPANGTAKLDARAGYNNTDSRLNGAAVSTRAATAGGNVDLNFHRGKVFFLSLEAAVDYTGQAYLGDMASHNNLWSERYGLNLHWQLPAAFVLKTAYALSVVSGSNLPSQEASMLSAFVARDFLSGHAAEIRLTGLNLLNTGNTYFPYAGVNFTGSSQSNTQGRILMLSLVYHLLYTPKHT